jgi:hypothetical protein
LIAFNPRSDEPRLDIPTDYITTNDKYMITVVAAILKGNLALIWNQVRAIEAFVCAIHQKMKDFISLTKKAICLVTKKY